MAWRSYATTLSLYPSFLKLIFYNVEHGKLTVDENWGQKAIMRLKPSQSLSQAWSKFESSISVADNKQDL